MGLGRTAVVARPPRASPLRPQARRWLASLEADHFALESVVRGEQGKSSGRFLASARTAVFAPGELRIRARMGRTHTAQVRLSCTQELRPSWPDVRRRRTVKHAAP